ncbi:ATP-citrate synthase [Coccidioides immitis RMSCC 3703]|uniref:ATP-citrate synthase n=1 Tax=Coccidioides immitis RMSCC 3703 TaxID=454286 RepID=A0A0J8R925_COCIT|nr:ATP-citrate synthase [Coccidioides immitis RMSCC 3703]
MQPRAVQGMLDFDFICKAHHTIRRRYWGTSETLLPVYQSVGKAMAKHTDVDVVVNFASSRSVYSSTMELMQYPQIKTIAIVNRRCPGESMV